MKLKITAALMALVLAPSMAMAMGGCSDGHKNVTASSCKEGSVYDAGKGECVLTPTT